MKAKYCTDCKNVVQDFRRSCLNCGSTNLQDVNELIESLYDRANTAESKSKNKRKNVRNF